MAKKITYGHRTRTFRSLSLKSLLMSWRPCFLSRGCTKTYFQSLVKYPVSKGMLTILVISRSISSRHTDRIDAGIGSSGHDFLLAKAGLRTSSSDNSEILDFTPSVPDFNYWIPDSLSAELVFRIPIVRGIPDSLSSIPRIPEANILWIPGSKLPCIWRKIDERQNW